MKPDPSDLDLGSGRGGRPHRNGRARRDRGDYPPAAVNVLVAPSESMAAFQVFLYGRFWVFTEERERVKVSPHL